jgi:hypothetical protein
VRWNALIVAGEGVFLFGDHASWCWFCHNFLFMDKSPLLQSFDAWLIGREAAEFEASIKIAPALAEHGERLVLKDSPNKGRREIRFPFVAEGSGNVCLFLF